MYNVSFGSVVPVRVYKNGLSTGNKKEIEHGIKQFREAISGIDDTFGDRDYQIMRKMAKVDPEYSLDKGLDADYYFERKNPFVKNKLSKFFRFAADDHGRYYFITGRNAQLLEEKGHAIGKAKQLGQGLYEAKRAYHETLNRIIESKENRLTEMFDSRTKRKLGNPVILNIMTGTYPEVSKNAIITDVNFSRFA